MANWQIGDLAVFVGFGEVWLEADGSCSEGPDPKPNEVCTVIGLDRSGPKGLALWLRGYTSDSYYAFAFRKIRPDGHEACEPEFVTLLKRTKVSA